MHDVEDRNRTQCIVEHDGSAVARIENIFWRRLVDRNRLDLGDELSREIERASGALGNVSRREKRYRGARLGDLSGQWNRVSHQAADTLVTLSTSTWRTQ